MCELLLLEEKRNLKGYAKLYSNSLQEFEKAEIIILFGSILKNKEFNDIDVLFITDSVKDVSTFCLELSRVRAKPVIPLILKKEDFIAKIKAENDVMLSIIKECIVLKGASQFMEVIRLATYEI